MEIGCLSVIGISFIVSVLVNDWSRTVIASIGWILLRTVVFTIGMWAVVYSLLKKILPEKKPKPKDYPDVAELVEEGWELEEEKK